MYSMLKATLLLLTLAATINENPVKSTDYETSDNGMLQFIIELLSNNPEKFASFLNQVFQHSTGGVIPDMRRFVPMPFDDSCTQCAAIFEALKTVAGLPPGIVELFLVDTCKELLGNIGWNGDIMCAPIIDNYGDHVFYIFENLNKTGEESCELLNFCTPALQKPAKLFEETKIEISEKFTDILKDASFIPYRRKRQVEKANTLKIAHLTDIHVEDGYVVGSATQCDLYICCRGEGNGISGSALPYGDYSCNLPPITVEKFLNFINGLNPDLVIYTGDSPPHALWAETLEIQKDNAIWVADSIARLIPGVPAYAAFANHECFPTNMFYAPDSDVKALTEAFYQAWETSSGFGPDQRDTITTAGYYSIDSSTVPNLKIVSINTNYGYVDNWYNLINDIEPGFIRMKQDIEEGLADAETNNKKVLLLLHHPSGGNVLHYDQWISDISVRYKETILFAVMGHTHNNHFQVIIDPSTGDPAVSHFTASAMDSHSGQNPGARVFYLDSTDLTPLYYEQYRIDYNALMGDPNLEPNVTMLYKSSDAYGIDDLTAASMYELTQRFEADDDLFNSYWSRRRLRPEDQGKCENDCKENEICRIRSSTIEQRRACEATDDDDGSGGGDTTTPGGNATTTSQQTTTTEQENSATKAIPSALICLALYIQLLLN